MIDQPEKNEILQGMNFRDVTISQDSAVAISRSIMLNFEIQDPEDSDEENSRPTRLVNNAMSKKDQVTCVSVHAIPVYDGHLINSESDI